MRDAPAVRARPEVDISEPASLQRRLHVSGVAEPCLPRDRGLDDAVGGVDVDETTGDRRPDAGELALLPVVDRLVVERSPRGDAEPSARTEGSRHVGERDVVLLDVGDDEIGDDDVERACRERKAWCSRGGPWDGRALVGVVEHRERRVDPDEDAAPGALGRTGGDDAGPGADVEHGLVGSERHELQDIACDGLEARVPRAVVFAGNGVVRLPGASGHRPARLGQQCHGSGSGCLKSAKYA